MFYQFSHFIVDTENKKLTQQGKVLSDDDKTISLLTILCENYPEVVDKEVLLSHLWADQIVTDWSLSKLVSDVRQLLGDSGKDQGHIKTIRGKGFRFNCEVATLDELPDKQKTNGNSIEEHSSTSFSNKSVKKNVIALITVSIFTVVMVYQFLIPKISDTKNIYPIRVAVMPAVSGNHNPINEWVKYGIMSMASEQLARFEAIQTLPVSNVISAVSVLGDLDSQDNQLKNESKYFDKVCGQIGCSHLILIKYHIVEHNDPVLTYQILKYNERSAISEFREPDIFDAAGLMLDQLADDLLPTKRIQLSLENTFTKDNKANRDYAIGVNELFSGDIKSAKIYLKLALDRQPNFFWARAQLADAYYRGGELDLATKMIIELKKLSISSQEIYFLDHLYSNVLYSQGQLDRSLEVSIGLKNNEFVINDPLLLGNELLNIGSGYQAKNELKKAADFLEQARIQYANANYGAGEGKVLFNLGNVYLTLSQQERAIKYYQKAREVFIQYGMDGYALMAKHQIASTSIHLGRIQYAEAELRQISKEYQKIGDLEGELTANVDLVYVSIAKPDYKEAIMRSKALLARIDETELSYLKSHLRKLLLSAHLKSGHVTQAEELIQFFDDQWHDQRPAFAFIPAHLMLLKGNFKEALQLALEIKKQLGSEWTEIHQAVLVQFEQALSQKEIILLSY